MPIDLISDIISEADLMFTPDPDFFNTTSILDIVGGISPTVEALLLSGLDEAASATGEFTITSGAITGSLTTSTQDIFPISFDASGFLESLRPTLSSASATVSLTEGIVNATYEFGDLAGEVVEFNLASFAAGGLQTLITWIDTSVPIENGALQIGIDTFLGPINGSIDFTGGDLDIALDTFLGDFDFSFDFDSDDQVVVGDIGFPLGDIVINFDTGNVELGAVPPIPLSSLSSDISLQDGIATISVSTPIGTFEPSFDLGELVNDVVFDTLTGLGVEASLLDGQFELLATRDSEQFQTSINLPEQLDDLVATVDQINGGFSLGAGVLSGELSIGQDNVFAISETVENIGGLLTTALGDILDLPPSA